MNITKVSLSLLFVLAYTLFFAPRLMAQTQMSEFLEKWNNSRDYLVQVIEAMPEDQLAFQPSDTVMTFQQHTLHMMRSIVFQSQRYLKAEDGLPINWDKKNWSKKELIDLVKDSFAYGEGVFSQLNDKELNEQVDFFAGSKSRRQVLAVIHDHITHHRAMMVVYLRLQGIQPPRYVGW